MKTQQRSFFDDEFARDMEVKKYPVFRPDEKKVQSMTERLQFILNDGKPHNAGELAMRVGHRFAIAVSELRNRGHKITREQDGTTHWYQLVGYSPRVKVTESMKASYYASPWWRSVRQQRIAHDSAMCVNCKSEGSLVVHHWKYQLFDERLCDLMTLCDSCHERIHSNPAIKVAFPKSVTPEIAQKLKD